MDVLESAVSMKIIREDVYRNLAVKTTKNMLESYGYKCGETIGSGCFGEVIEVENKQKSTKVAAKIVLDLFATKSEIDVWPKLKSEYILPLLGQVKFYDAPTRVFFSPLCEETLSSKLENEKFFQNRKSFKMVKNWLLNIVNGITYLHGEFLCHLDLKLTNVLIKKNGKACICDLGCVFSSEDLVDSYASPLFYRAPEAQITREGQTSVNGIKYDIWTLGVTALEMFTRKMLSQTLQKTTGGRIYSWYEQVYPIMFHILEGKNFEVLIQRFSPRIEVSRKKLVNIKNYIISCLNAKPEARPSSSDLLSHKVFGGSYKFVAPASSVEIWDKHINSMTLEKMINRSMELQIRNCDIDAGGDTNAVVIFEKCKSNRTINMVETNENTETDSTDMNGVVVFEKCKSRKTIQMVEMNEKTETDSTSALETASDGIVVDIPEMKKKKSVRKWITDKFKNFRKLFTACVPSKN